MLQYFTLPGLRKCYFPVFQMGFQQDGAVFHVARTFIHMLAGHLYLTTVKKHRGHRVSGISLSVIAAFGTTSYKKCNLRNIYSCKIYSISGIKLQLQIHGQKCD